MIINSYDDRSPAKINVKKNENAVQVDAVIYTFSQEIEKYVTENYNCEKIGEYSLASGAHSAFVLNYNGKKYGFFKTWVGAPVCVAPIEELTTVMETNKFIHFGGAGCLDKEIARGKVMIPTEAYRDEGTSYHYIPASRYIDLDKEAIDAIERSFKKQNLPFLGAVPIVMGLREGGDKGVPAAMDEQSIVGKQFAEIAKKIMAY